MPYYYFYHIAPESLYCPIITLKLLKNQHSIFIQVCEDESPQSPEGSQVVISGDTPGEIPLDRLESDDGEASEDGGEEDDASDIEIVHEGQKEFRKYWEDFDEETSGGVGIGGDKDEPLIDHENDENLRNALFQHAANDPFDTRVVFGIESLGG